MHLAPKIFDDILCTPKFHGRAGGARECADMRRSQDIGQRCQRPLAGFLLKDIEGRSRQRPRLQGLKKCLLIHQISARGVDQETPLFHFRKFGRSQQRAFLL